jgi:tRNA-2-methylthio-N6-dimethylallyladenosine synthase
MAETPTVMPSLHMPLQSGSDRVLREMRRSYRRDRFLSILDEVRASIPAAAITTDIIVGFPGESEADFADTLEIVERARFSAAFSFQYSPRPGTPAAEMVDQIPKAVVQERYERLVEALERISWEENLRLVGNTAEVLVAEGEGRKDEQTQRMSGRARDGRLVHFSGAGTARPGDCVMVRLEAAAPHHLTGRATSIRTTRAGDAWEAGQLSCGTGSAPDDSGDQGPVTLGMPGLRPVG